MPNRIPTPHHRKNLLGSILLAVVLSLGPGVQNVQAQERFYSADQLADKVDSMLENGKAAEALRLARAQLARPEWQATDRARIHTMMADACLAQEDTACYTRQVDAAISENAQTGHYYAAVQIYSTPDKTAAAESYAWLVEHAPDEVINFDVRHVWSFIRPLREAGREERVYDLLRGLHTARYAGGHDGVLPTYLYIELVRLALKHRERDDAIPEDKIAEIARTNIRGIDAVIHVWNNRAFEDLWPMLEADGMFEADRMRAEQMDMSQLKYLQDISDDWNIWLGNHLDAIQALRATGLPKLAERQIRFVLDAVPEEEKTTENYFWMQNELAYIYEDLGRTDDALAVMAQLATQSVEEQPSIVSQVINYADMLERHGHFTEAIRIADTVRTQMAEQTSDYGLYWALSIKACALQSLDRDAEAREIFNDMRTHEDSNIAALTMASLCLGEDDYTASLYIKRLADEHQRDGALLALSEFNTPEMPNERDKLRTRLARIARQPDMVVAVQKVGRLRKWDFPRTYWGSF